MKNLEILGKALSQNEQKAINGGQRKCDGCWINGQCIPFNQMFEIPHGCL